MNITARTLAPLVCASDETRANLNALRFEPDGRTVATNGHVLATFVPERNETDPEPLGEAFSIDAARLGDLVKEQKGKKSNPAAVDTQATRANGTLNVTTANGALAIPKQQDVGDYPDWRAIHTGPADDGVQLCLSLKVLEQVIETARRFTRTKKGEPVPIKLTIPQPIDTTAPDKPSVMAVMTPIHIECESRESADTLELCAMPMRW